MQERTRKQVILSAILAAALTVGLAVSGFAAADTPPPTAPPAPTEQMGSPVSGNKQVKGHKDQAMREKLDKFLEETRPLRRQLVSKRDAHIALMHAAQPNIAQIQQISGELFDLREDLKNKAKAAGLPFKAVMASLDGSGCGHHRHHGHGMGHGRGPGHSGPHGERK